MEPKDVVAAFQKTAQEKRDLNQAKEEADWGALEKLMSAALGASVKLDKIEVAGSGHRQWLDIASNELVDESGIFKAAFSSVKAGCDGGLPTRRV